MEGSIQNDINYVLYKPLKSRFYILFTLSLFNFLCGFLWNPWAPIMISVQQLYNWNLTEINLQANLFSIAFCVLVVPFVYIWNKKGIRLIYFISSLLLVIGTFIRLYPGSIFVQSVLIQIGSAITGCGAVISLIANPVISMLWFPSGERTRATAAPLALNTLGTALSPIIASYMVPIIQLNQTNFKNVTETIENGIRQYMFLHCSIAVVTLILVIIYFPSKPHIQPCKSSDISLRLDMLTGTKILMKNKQYWIIFFVNMIVYGFNSATSAVAVTYLLPMGINQKEAGILGFVTNVVCVVSCLIGGYLGDKFSYKTIVISTVPSTFILYTISGLQCLKIIPQRLLYIYVISLLQSLLSNYASPVTFEMSVEAAFPVSEEVSTAVMAFATNFGIVLFLSVCMIPNIGTSWIPFSYAFLSLFLLPLMWFYKDERNRTKFGTNFVGGKEIVAEFDYGIQVISEEAPLLG